MASSHAREDSQAPRISTASHESATVPSQPETPADAAGADAHTEDEVLNYYLSVVARKDDRADDELDCETDTPVTSPSSSQSSPALGAFSGTIHIAYSHEKG